jgi:hypothetical protein
MFETPKELPHINTPQFPAKAGQLPQIDSGNLTIKTENPINEMKKNLLSLEIPRSQEIIIAPPGQKTELSLPVLEDEMPNFDEAIKSMHHDIMKIGHEEQRLPEKEELYQPKELGEGYFSEISHYLKNKDSKEIADDIIKKDFLNGMKDYHDQKAQGKPYYLHEIDLQAKLAKKMNELMKKEEQWHSVKKTIEEHERKRKSLELEIDSEGQELKELFKLIKANQILEKEAKPNQLFQLRSGQKLKSLNDLRKALSYIPDEEYNHHANEERNDFASWSENALELPEIGNKIRQAKNKEELAIILKDNLF